MGLHGFDREEFKETLQRICESNKELISMEVCSFPVNRIHFCITELNLEDRSALLPACWMHSRMRGTSLGSKVFFRVDLQWIRALICSSSLSTDYLLSVINSVYITKK